MKPTVPEQVAFYNAEWAIEERAFPNPYQLCRALAIIDAIADMHRTRPAIFELGSGTGWLTAMLGTIGDSAGIDLSDVAVQRAQSRFSHVRFESADALTFAHPVEAFDVVVSHEVIEHVDDQQRYVDVAYAMLRPHGRLVLTTPNARAVAYMAPEERSHQPNENLLTKSKLQKLLRTRFANARVSSLIMGGATRGIYRLLNSRRLHRTLRDMGLYRAFETLALRADLGLHLIAVADKGA